MKNAIKTLAIVVALQFSLPAIAQSCKDPISGTTFQTWFNEVAVMPTNEAKLAKASGYVNNGCMLASQVKSMSQLFTDDNPRYEFCKLAYTHTFDRVNFFEVYDGFTKFSLALKLYDYTQSLKTSTPAVTPPSSLNTSAVNLAPVAEMTFPNYSYPAYQPYNGKKGCAGPVISETIFRPIALNIFKQTTEDAKVNAIQSAAEKNCLSMAMAMKLASLLKEENTKFETMVVIFPKLHDLENYESAKALFPTELLKTEWSKYAKGSAAAAVTSCVVSDANFAVIVKDLEAQKFPDGKMATFEMINKDRCFSTEQVKQLTKQFNFGDQKLKLMKAAYAKCTDRNNYYKLVETLTFTKDKEELQNYIKNN